MHIGTRSWRTLSKESRDEKLLELGLSQESLARIRAYEPRTRLIEAARSALTIDPAPNSDLIEFIAGYKADGALFRHFDTLRELLALIPVHDAQDLHPIETASGEIDLAKIIPKVVAGHRVYFEEAPQERVAIWQKVPGGVRVATVNRRIPKLLSVAGVILYSAEGSKNHGGHHTPVQLANATPGIHRLFLEFLEGLGVSKTRIKARVQLHDLEDQELAVRYWTAETGLGQHQFQKPLMAPKKGEPRRKTFTLTLKYDNSMLSLLLTAWSSDPQTLHAHLKNL